MERFAKYGFNNISLKWHRYYNGAASYPHIDFIPEHLFYGYIEPALNRVPLHPAWEDKASMEKFVDPNLTPNTMLKNCNGFYYINDEMVSLDEALEYCSELSQFVIKHSMGTWGGNGVRKIVLDNSNDKKKFLKALFDEYKKDFVVQEILKQSAELSKFNPTSINTIRVMSYLRPSGVVILSKLLRTGKEGSFTDNTSSGGVAFGVDLEGKLTDFGIDQFGVKTKSLGDDDRFNGFVFPENEKIVATIEKVHKQMPYFRLVSWDVMVNDKSEIKIIEFNTFGQGINLHQITNGPLFGEYFDEIMEIAKNYDKLSDIMNNLG
ncbi:hypothetical protein GO009_14925 [Muricauda sp. TY007]|uniref:sugar-transfer associated ATP-grasp domain-containing protein n=1 Tax=Allomuricauda sp. TY007 TaxID=2683200 RepID=UPI0013C10D36|nr:MULTISPECIES: sugar-transfer associated ATP-grasp domain-containing protein [unclassified Allomuricauda]MBA4744730.1 hypothetical protein [Allomuricauda sp.]NDV17315.1 hypothetical protein [Muricauda sp. TY007]